MNAIRDVIQWARNQIEMDEIVTGKEIPGAKNMLLAAAAELAAQDARIAELEGLLQEIDGWIDYWEPEFVDDLEWEEVDMRIAAALKGKPRPSPSTWGASCRRRTHVVRGI